MTDKQAELKESAAGGGTEPIPTYNRKDPWPRRIAKFAFIVPVIKGLAYPLLKVCYIAMAEKLLREVIEGSIDPQFFERINEEIFEKSENPVMDIYLMRNLTFYEAFIVTACIAFTMGIVQPITKALQECYINFMEVKRLQDILYDRFILEPNSVAIDEATDLLYTKIAKVEEWVRVTKYQKVGDSVTILWCLVLLLTLSWDMGLGVIGSAMFIFFVTAKIWSCLSTPWLQQKDEKVQQCNAHLIDVVVCKEVVLTQAQELKEQKKLHQLMESDRQDIRKLVSAKFISESTKTFCFVMLTPSLFLIIYEVDLSMERVFQLLILIVIMDELMRSFLELATHGDIETEYERAKATFCHVLGLEEEVLFPSSFGEAPPIGDYDDDDDNDDGEKAPGLMDGSMKDVSYKDAMDDRSKRRRQLRSSMMTMSTKLGNALSRRAGLNAQGMDELAMKFVSFGYKKKNGEVNTIMQNLNMKLTLGENYAIMGESGVGKSTILKALSGLHEPLAGDIYFDGEAVDTTSIIWREKVAVVQQDSVFLNRTLRENLVYGLGEPHTDEEILDALDKVKMKHRILEQPGGLDMVVEQNGGCFSGGQRQRLQIARLLLTTAPLVLLDECTSALDPTTTEEVLDILKVFMKGKTMIMITHDFDTLILADHVLEVKHGGVVEEARKNRVASIYSKLNDRRPSELMKAMSENVIEEEMSESETEESEGSPATDGTPVCAEEPAPATMMAVDSSVPFRAEEPAPATTTTTMADDSSVPFQGNGRQREELGEASEQAANAEDPPAAGDPETGESQDFDA